jgi:UDP-N-acetyl-D-mannosaminuronic acid dehydrogenase
MKAMDTKNTKVACLGLAFKPNIDDLRESPAVQIVKSLAKEGVQVLAVEPHVDELPQELKEFDNVTLAETSEALKQSDVVALLVDHHAFSHLGLGDVKGKSLIDTRGMIR